MGRSADRPPDGIVDVYLEGRPKGELEIELRIFPAPPPGPRLEERVRGVAGVARHCLKAADRLFHPGTGPPSETPSEPEARGIDGEAPPPAHREFCQFFELLFRQVMADVMEEGRNLIRPEERLHVNLQWGTRPGGYPPGVD